ncbi:MAG: glycine cleavage system aminomethyltransferase GcvT [Bacteroidales bacterium]
MTKIQRTPLYDNHVKHGGKMVEFAGFELPIQYESGIVVEHNAVRNQAGLFDVSHMGEFLITGKGAQDTVNNLITNDVTTLINQGDILYTLMCNEKGGVVDDLLVYKYSNEHYLLVVNASNIEKDFAWVTAHLGPETKAENISDTVAQLALQGPLAEKILSKIIPLDKLPAKNYTFVEIEAWGTKCLISRTGYTGEDGFEIYVPSNSVATIFESLLETGKEDGLIPCGLGSRDTLRFEAGMPLYGHELGEDIPANEVGLGFCIKMKKDTFIGKAALEANPAQYIRKGVKLIDRGVARENTLVFKDGQEVGYVTTGTFSVTNNCAMAMIRVRKGTESPIDLEVRKKMLKAEYQTMPFIQKKNNK